MIEHTPLGGGGETEMSHEILRTLDNDIVFGIHNLKFRFVVATTYKFWSIMFSWFIYSWNLHQIEAHTASFAAHICIILLYVHSSQ